jgi:hypothetical protein
VFLQPPQSPPPVIVKLIPPKEPSQFQQLADVLFGALGITGVLVLGAVLLGLLVAGVMFWVRSRSEPPSMPGGPPYR